MNVRDSIRKVSALAGSTLMIGLSLGSAASLADFPGKYVDSQGTPTAEVVVGSQGSVADVVGAVQIGAALGQSSLRVGQVRDQRTVEVAGGSSWSTDGALLNSRNDDLYGGEDIDTVRQTLTADDLDALSSTTFQDAAGNSQDIEQYLYVGSQPSGFGNPGDTSDQDPFQYVYNPTSVSDTWNLYRLQANFGDGLELSDTSQDDNANDDVLGEDLELFGKSFTISEDTFTSDHEGQLVLYGSSQEYDLETGESTEFEIDGQTHTLEVRAVTDSSTAAFYLDGELREQSEDGSVNVDGTDVRVSDVIQTSSDTSEGLVTFAIGSEEYVLEDGEPIEDSDGDEIEGTHVNLEGSSVGSSNTLADDVELSTIEVSVGAADSDDTYVRAGESFQDPVFDDIVFRNGGLLPDAGEQDEPTVSVDADDDTASVTFTPQGEDRQSVEFFKRVEAIDGDFNGLADSDGDQIVAVEGDQVNEDEYFVADAGGFTNMFEVTGVDVANDDSGAVDEGTVELRDVLSGSTVEVDLTETGDNTYRFQGTEVIDGQTYYFEYKEAGGFGPGLIGLYATWGTDAGYDATGSAGSGVTTAFPSVETESGGLLSFYDPNQEPTSFGESLYSFRYDVFFVDVATEAPEGANGFSVSDPILRVINGHEGVDNTAVDATGGDSIIDLGDAPSNNVEYYDDDGNGEYDSGDEVYVDQDKDGVYTGQADDLVAGNAPSNGADVTTQNGQDTDWDISYIDANDDGGGWDSNEDSLILDLDDDGSFTANADTTLEGVKPADGASLTDGGNIDSAWSGASAGDIMFYDADSNDGGWDASTDAIWVDNPGGTSDGAYVDADDNLLAGTAPSDTTPKSGDGVDAADWSTIKVSDDSPDDDWDAGVDAIVEDTDADGTYSRQADTVFGETPSDGASFTSTGDFDADWSLDSYDADSGDGAWNGGEDAIIIDVGDRGTYSESPDLVVNYGDDDTQDVSDGQGGNDLDTTEFYAVDVDGGDTLTTGDEIAEQVKGDNDNLGTNTLTEAASDTKYTGINYYESGEAVVIDEDGDDDFSEGDTILYNPNNRLVTASKVQYWSSDSSAVSGVTDAVETLRTNIPNPSVVFLQEEDDRDAQEAYALTPAWDGGDSEVEVGGEDVADAVEHSGSRTRVNLESNDDVYVSYDRYGIHVREDQSDTGTVELFYPETQSTVGAAFTGAGDSLAESATGTQQATVEYRGVKNERIRGRLPAFASVDSDITDQQKNNRHLILVGGPAVNQLVADLAQQNDDVWTQDQWQDREGEAVLQLVEDAFAEGSNALIVAGHSAEDTVRAAQYIANWKEHRSSLRGTNLYQPE